MMFTVLGSYLNLCKVEYPKNFQLDSENAATIFRCIRWNKQNSCLLLFFTGKARWKFPDFLQEGFCCNSTFFFFFQFNQETQSNTSITQREELLDFILMRRCMHLIEILHLRKYRVRKYHLDYGTNTLTIEICID